MRTKTIQLYQFDELTKEAQEYAIEQYRNEYHDIFWTDEILESLKGLFNNCDNIKLKDYSIGECHSWLKIEFDRDEIAEFTGKRALAWIENNLLSNIRISKVSLSIKTSSRYKMAQYGRYYRAGMIKPCPFTGVCFDEDLLDDLLKNIKSNMTLEDSFRALANTCQKLYNNEIEYQNSKEYIKEYFESNGVEFLEDGKEA